LASVKTITKMCP